MHTYHLWFWKNGPAIHLTLQYYDLETTLKNLIFQRFVLSEGGWWNVSIREDIEDGVEVYKGLVKL
jgi:hypothetical protein